MSRKYAPLKVPQWLTKPSASWTEHGGIQRAVAVLKTEAKLLRKEGFALQPNALMVVARALSESINRGHGKAEAESLRWAERDADASLPAQER